jgi:hypothetical protein
METTTEKSERTSIAISTETKCLLDKYGKKNDSYEDIIKRLIESYEINYNR